MQSQAQEDISAAWQQCEDGWVQVQHLHQELEAARHQAEELQHKLHQAEEAQRQAELAAAGVATQRESDRQLCEWHEWHGRQRDVQVQERMARMQTQLEELEEVKAAVGAEVEVHKVHIKVCTGHGLGLATCAITPCHA